MRYRIAGMLMLALATFGHAQEEVNALATLVSDNGRPEVVVRFTVPPEHYVYADQLSVTAVNVTLDPVTLPQPEEKDDPFSGEKTAVYTHDFTLRYRPSVLPANGIELEVRYQACNQSICFRPETKTFTLGGEGMTAPAEPSRPTRAPLPQNDAVGWEHLLPRFRVGGSYAGYIKPVPFISFLEEARHGEVQQDALRSALETQGVWLMVLLILAGGLALNLTPCVLPMIPVNIAIIGAGAQASSRSRGFALGAAYGLGIALVYGVLGLVVILTGAKFGTLNASPWFNLAIALIFILLSLAMFDIFTIDLSRFQAHAGTDQRRGGFITALVLGGIAALLAGACVAPVLISVLLLAADLYARGTSVGLLLPFLLGFGMALPWPFAGAGLSFLPKPGKWMERVKFGFGVMILLVALWYGKLGVSLLMERRHDDVMETAQEEVENGWLTSLDRALAQGLATGQPVFIDFWASWCKNCLKMDQTTFKDPAVIDALDDFVRVKVQAEDISDPDTKAMLDRFNAVGLPTYVVLIPHKQP